MNTVEAKVGSFLPNLTILLIYLKLTYQIDWGWVWVISPIIFMVAANLVIGVIYYFFIDPPFRRVRRRFR